MSIVCWVYHLYWSCLVVKAIQGNVLVQVAPLDGQICNWCQWRHFVAKITTGASCAIWCPNVQTMPEVQQTQAIEFETWIFFAAKINANSIQFKRLFKLQTQCPGSVVPLAILWRRQLHYMPKKGGRIIISFCLYWLSN